VSRAARSDAAVIRRAAGQRGDHTKVFSVYDIWSIDSCRQQRLPLPQWPECAGWLILGAPDVIAREADAQAPERGHLLVGEEPAPRHRLVRIRALDLPGFKQLRPRGF